MLKSPLIFAFLLGFLGVLCGEASDMDIPEREMQKIGGLFEYCIRDETFAYTLFGNKPISVIDSIKTPMVEALFYPINYFNIASNWRVWKKYRHLYPMKKFVLIDNESRGNLQIYLINRKSCIEKITEHLSLFQEILGCNSSPKEILARLEIAKDLMLEGLNKSQILYGILLGYGRENAEGYDQLFCKRRYFLNLPKGLNGDHHWRDPFFVHLPCFASFSENETAQLRKEHEKCQQEIVNAYTGHDLVEVTLRKLIEEMDE